MIRLHDIKVYQINTNFYEFDGHGSNEDKIIYMVNRHRQSVDNLEEVGRALPEFQRDEVKYQFYIFNQIERESTWKKFLPGQIIGEEDFNVQTASFVLFAILDSKIFAIIGGSGMVVIVRYLNHTFGLDLFEKISDPAEDIVSSIESRGITGNLAAQKETYRKDQRLLDTLSFTRIPVRVNVQLRDVLVADVFDFLDFNGEEKVFLEIGKSFHIKCKISFDETHKLLLKINQILQLQDGKPLSRYERIRDENLIENSLRLDLYTRIRDDMMRRIPPGSLPNAIRFDHDFVHPSKLETFYECDTYKMFARDERKPFFVTQDRTKLYDEGLRFLYDNAQPNQSDFNYIITGIRVKGYIKDEEKTVAMFTQHLTCEIPFMGKPIFLIDSRWYKVKGDFIAAINDQCVAMIKANYWNTNVIKKWNQAIRDEGDYNLLYANASDFLVLDKKLGQNIELCDLMYEDDSTLYLIHVKKGFDAKMRDLSNQISLSAMRLWNDVKSSKFEFVDQVLESYNRDKDPDLRISNQHFRAKFAKDIVYVMAFSSELSQNRRVIDNITQIRSNIAKFCLVQGVKEMQTHNYSMKIIEIESE